MISDKERREAAESLRYISQHPPEWATSACAIAEVFDADYPLWADSGELFAMLADLIDRPTCRNVYDEHEMGACENGFECSVCGNRVEDFEHCCITGTFNYCPKCGREVVDE